MHTLTSVPVFLPAKPPEPPQSPAPRAEGPIALPVGCYHLSVMRSKSALFTLALFAFLLLAAPAPADVIVTVATTSANVAAGTDVPIELFFLNTGTTAEPI